MSGPLHVNDPRDLMGHKVGLDEISRKVPDAKSEPPLIVRERGETLAAFYERAHILGIGRKCLSCGGKRPYSLVQCPYCFTLLMTEVRIAPSKVDPENLPAVIPETRYDIPEGNAGYSYTPLDPDAVDGNPREEKPYINQADLPKEERSSKVSVSVPELPSTPPGPPKPLESMNLVELTDYAKLIGLDDIPPRPTKAQLRASIHAFLEPPTEVLPELPPVDHAALADAEAAELAALNPNAPKAE